jgi:hypothetical protein
MKTAQCVGLVSFGALQSRLPPFGAHCHSPLHPLSRRSPDMRIVVIIFLVLIVASLASALVFLVKDRGTGSRTVRALALRVGLSITLFLLLMAGFASGLIPGKL